MGEMITGEFVRTAIEQRALGAVARVTLNRPDLHNAFNEVMIQELQSTFAAFNRQSEVRVVVLQAESKSFCAGADLNWMKKMVDYTFEQNVEDAHALAAMLRTIHDCPKPVIARVHGAAFGGGVGLVAACDMAVAVENATFSLSEVKLGLLPAVISPFVLKKIGSGNAHRYFLTAERFSAAEALRIGLLHEIVRDANALDAAVDRLIEALLNNGPEAVAHCKVLIEQVCHMEWNRAVDITTKMIAERRSSREGQEGMKAFLEKRSPNWTQSQAASQAAGGKGS
jgi:methylglutaconyl-CoA hydratase